MNDEGLYLAAPAILHLPGHEQSNGKTHCVQFWPCVNIKQNIACLVLKEC